VIGVVVDRPIKLSVLGSALQAAGDGLGDIDADQVPVFVFGRVKSDCGETNGCAGDPGQSLQLEDAIRIVGEGFIHDPSAIEIFDGDFWRGTHG